MMLHRRTNLLNVQKEKSMKHSSLLLAVATTATLAGASSAMAGAEVGSWYVAPQAVYVDPDRLYNADESIGGSLAIGKVLSKNWDAELGYVDSRHDVTGGGNKLKLAGPSIYLNRVFMRDNAVNPFIGVGFYGIGSRDNGTGQSHHHLGAGIKAGILADLTSNGALQLSAEVGKRSDNFSDHLEDVFAGLGLHFNFGAPAKAAPAPVVVAAAPAPAPVPVAPPPPADSDQDGVIDPQDMCPNTVAGAKVDAKGCEMDNDGDGVVNRLDKCPRTPAGDKVDAVGCGVNIALEVQFDTNSATIKPESYAELDSFVQFFNDVPSAKGELQGHTDNVGKDAYNLKLSQRRAESVKAYVLSKGVEAARITSTKGYGESQPVADNTTVEGRAANRRVLFVRSDWTK
jgi:OOP family OmpA-OmpF porin